MILSKDVSEEKTEEVVEKKSLRGFASMSKEKQAEIASKGGKAAHEKGTAHQFTTNEAREAGKKGGATVAQTVRTWWRSGDSEGSPVGVNRRQQKNRLRRQKMGKEARRRAQELILFNVENVLAGKGYCTCSQGWFPPTLRHEARTTSPRAFKEKYGLQHHPSCKMRMSSEFLTEG